MSEANRPLSRNADIQTDVTDEFPPLFQDRANKQVRSNEKNRHTKLITGIEKHMAELGSRTELNFMRKNLANQLEDCIRAHNFFRSSPTQRQIPENDWITNLEQNPRIARIPQILITTAVSKVYLQARKPSVFYPCELQRLQATIAQIDQQNADEAVMRTQTINEKRNRNLAAWLKEHNEALAKEQQERKNLEASLKTDLRNQQRLLEDEKCPVKRTKISFKRSWRLALANSPQLSTKN
ncbi:hypothetical protein DAPPUDRAFT_117461 [Daphnia pulex]|uniref:Uncharacterized protein n=1 Tax=Daphnia pulex TaxID=6669 RepID=E9HSR2_DAPPU|nr:hypothetical protein DAPPUDRAFT_117461 [Daphnia pulex]|eukprot:EFX65206.1 hypothetical protein DAPPUDRAFT_117461 [Daphnia pulex]